VESGELGVENWEWRIGSGELRVESWELGVGSWNWDGINLEGVFYRLRWFIWFSGLKFVEVDGRILLIAFFLTLD
jgi:hypothetical protein